MLQILFALTVVVFLRAGCLTVTRNFEQYGCQAKQSEAKTSLKMLYVAEEAFRAEFDRYSADLKEIGFAEYRNGFRYTVVAVVDNGNPSAPTFRGIAIANAFDLDGLLGDVWTIDHEGSLHHRADGCGL